MMISTKGKYGLMAMVDMAVNSSEEYIPLKGIADRQNISSKYLEQVFVLLKNANLIKSVKGYKGGYALSKTPSKIIVGDILRVLEGDLTVAKHKDCCDFNINTIENCIELSVWRKVDESINKLVDSITLEQLACEYKFFKDSNNQVIINS